MLSPIPTREDLVRFLDRHAVSPFGVRILLEAGYSGRGGGGGGGGGGWGMGGGGR